MHLGQTVPDRVELTGVTAGQVHRVRRVPADLAADRRGQLLGADLPGAGREVHDGAFVVAGEHRIELPRVGTQCIGEGLRHPARVRVGERGVADGIGGGRRRELGNPRCLVLARDGAQHAVDETRTHRIEFDAGLLDRGVHGGVGIDTDHPVHRYFLAAKQTEFAVGGATGQLLQIGRELAETPV